MLRSTYPRGEREKRVEGAANEEKEEEEEMEDGDKRERWREEDDGERWQCVYARKTWYHRRHRRRLLRPPRHDVPIYGTRRNARVRGGNLDSNIELSVNVSFFPRRPLVDSFVPSTIANTRLYWNSIWH